MKCKLCDIELISDDDIGYCISKRPLTVLCWDCSESPGGNVDGMESLSNDIYFIGE